jgi:integrase
MKMKPLKVSQYRDYYVINAARVGLPIRYGHFNTEAEARQAADEMLAKFTLGLISEPSAVQLVKDAAANFMARQEERVQDGEISQAHFEDIERAIKFALKIRIDAKAFSHHDLAKLVRQENSGDLSAAFVRAIKAEGKSKATAEKRIKGLKMLLNHCQVKGWINVNPLDKVTLGISSEISDRAPRIQPETIQQLISAGLEGETLMSRAMVITALSSGIRQGELRALTWGSIDFAAAELSVSQAVKHGRGATIGAPKTKRGFRVIPLPAETINVLRQLRVQSKHSLDTDLVFATDAGLPKQKKTLRELIDRASDRAGIERMVWGDMRHFFASVQLSALGEDWSEVASLMGHSNPSFTYRQYGHYSRNTDKQDKARSAAASAIFG